MSQAPLPDNLPMFIDQILQHHAEQGDDCPWHEEGGDAWQDQLPAMLHLIRKHLHHLCMVEGCQLVVAELKQPLQSGQQFDRILAKVQEDSRHRQSASGALLATVGGGNREALTLQLGGILNPLSMMRKVELQMPNPSPSHIGREF